MITSICLSVLGSCVLLLLFIQFFLFGIRSDILPKKYSQNGLATIHIVALSPRIELILEKLLMGLMGVIEIMFLILIVNCILPKLFS